MNTPSTIDALRAELLFAANELFENDDKAAYAWLNRPLQAIGGEKPTGHRTPPRKTARYSISSTA